jgi:signal transduction histidine kinase
MIHSLFGRVPGQPAAAMREPPLSVGDLLDRAISAARALASGPRPPGGTQPVRPATRMAPELSGRTGRAVDQRSDLYALGATLYEWATGGPPFAERDPLRLMHEQLTQAPVAPIQLRPDLPPPLSDCILRLLEKEPESRYHSPHGLVHDLQRIQRGEISAFALGERDFPQRLAAPEQPVGRRLEIGRLEEALERASRGQRQVVLVFGAAGMGKSSLVSQLRTRVADRNGRMVAGKFDQYSRNDASATTQVLGALGRLLLAEPDAELAEHRRKILEQLGAQAGIACAVPEFKLLLGNDIPAPAAADPAHAATRLTRAMVGIVAAVASPARPLVLVLDDLQWSLAPALRLIDDVLESNGLAGVLVVATIRDSEQAGPDLLHSMLSRWLSHAAPPEVVRLESLGDEDVAEMLAQMLRITSADALPLARTLAPQSGGNPYDTLELVNALRDEGLLTQGEDGWRWDERRLGRYVGGASVVDLLAVRIVRLAPAARELLQSIACLGHEVPRRLALAATGLGDGQLGPVVAALVDEGLLLEEHGSLPMLRPRHDRVQQVAYGMLAERARLGLHHSLARRLAAAKGFDLEAAEQYLAASSEVSDTAECVAAACLLRGGAARARSLASYDASLRHLEAALSLLARAASAGAGDALLEADCDIDLHETLYVLGRLSEGDAVCARIEARETDPLRLLQPVYVQIGSLNSRGRSPDAAAHGLAYLRRLGFDVPERFESEALAPELARVRRWVEDFDPVREQSREPARRADVLAAAKILVRIGLPAATYHPWLACWVVLRCQALWEEHGPCPPLAPGIARILHVLPLLGDWQTGHVAAMHMLDFARRRGWDLETAYLCQILAVLGAHWFEPLENVREFAARAREGLVAAGELPLACFTYMASANVAGECGPTLDDYAREIRAASDFTRRAGNWVVAVCIEGHEFSLRALRGDPPQEGSHGLDEAAARLWARAAATPIGRYSDHLARASAAAYFGDGETLSVHARALLPEQFPGAYSTAQVHWFRALATAWEFQRAGRDGAEADAANLHAMDESIAWLRGRAAQAPANFRHLYLHAEAERAWAAGDVGGAVAFFDGALDALEGLSRPGHRPLLTERFARFQLAQGWAHGGKRLLREAQRLFLEWGAFAKVEQLERLIGPLPHSIPNMKVLGTSLSADELDALAILRASQALSSERSLGALRSRVEEVLRSMTGATRVVLALRGDDTNSWEVRQGASDEEPTLCVDAAGHLLPLAAFRYAERTREPLLLADALADDRFARDPYFRGMERCSLMVVPILHYGVSRAVLVLENSTARAAFGTARLDAVMMIAGQLAVSLESAQLYQRLEHKVQEQTQQLREAQSRLLAEAHRAGMAQIATNVLHNVGNVLNSVNVSTRVLADRVRHSRAARVADVAQMLDLRTAELMQGDEKARLLPGYVRELAQTLQAEREELLGELKRLASSVDHIKNVVAMQQSYAGASGVLEEASITQLVEDALRIQDDTLVRHAIEVRRDYAEVPPMPVDKTRVMQILVNLIGNARQAMQDVQGDRRLDVSVRQDEGWIGVGVADTGCGIAQENLAKIFSHGFTTKVGGHGFGLHSCAVAAHEMGGTLAVHSEGAGRGTRFTLRLPPPGMPVATSDPDAAGFGGAP